MHSTSSTNILGWPQREACANLPDQIKSTAEQGQVLLATIAEAPKCGSMMQMNQDSIVNFVKNVIRMCEMIPKPDPAGLQDRSERRDDPARHNEPAEVIASDQGNVVKALEEIKKLKLEMDAKVAAVEAAIRTQNQSAALTLANGPGQATDKISETLRKTTHNFAPVPTFGAIGQLERTRTCGEASVDLRSDTPIFGSFRSASQSTPKPVSALKDSFTGGNANARAAETIRKPEIGAMTKSDAAHVAAVNHPEASDSRVLEKSRAIANNSMDPSNLYPAVAPASGVSLNVDPTIIRPSVMDTHAEATGAVLEPNTEPSADKITDQSMSGCDVNDTRSSIDRTAAASAVSGEVSETTEKPGYVSSNKSLRNKTPSYSYGQAVNESASDRDSSSSTDQSVASSPSIEEASESTERVRHDATEGSNSDQTATQSTIRPSESATFIAPEKTDDGTDDEDSDDESGEEESDDDGTSEGDSDDSSSGDEDTQMEDTETSEQSEDSDVPNPKPIEVWRTTIAKPQSTGTPKSIRAVSPSQTIPAAPIRRRNRFMRVWITVPDSRIISDLQRMAKPELKCRLEREILCKQPPIRSCRVSSRSGKIRLYTTDGPGSRLLQKPSNWRSGAFGKGATVLAHRPRRNLPLP